MKQTRFAIFMVVLAAWAFVASCANPGKFRGGPDLMGVVEMGPFPKQSAGVGGYNLYISESKDGPYEKANTDPILGGTRLMVPYLVPDKEYYFRMTSVAVKDVTRESAPGQVFQRKAKRKGP